MPEAINAQHPAPPRKEYRYTPWSYVAGPLGLGFGLSLGKLIGEVLVWGKVATIAAEFVIAAVVLVCALAINFIFGNEVEVTEKSSS